MVMGGEMVKAKQIDPNNYRIATAFPIDDELFLAVPAIVEEESIDEYLNHSCDPTVWLKDEVTVVAKRNIEAGEEITLDSATWYCDPDKKWLYSDSGDCYCRSSRCRKKFTHNDWKIKKLQEKYKGHFSPYIQKKINQFNKK